MYTMQFYSNYIILKNDVFVDLITVTILNIACFFLSFK